MTRREHDARDAVGQANADFPQVTIQFANQRHSERPAELHGLYIFAYGFFVCRRKSTQPFTNRLITGIGTGAVRKVALEWLKLGGFPYSKENEGSFLIFLED